MNRNGRAAYEIPPTGVTIFTSDHAPREQAMSIRLGDEQACDS